MNVFNMPVSAIKGIGPKRAEAFKKLNINSVYDLINHFPFRYQDRSVFYDIENLGFVSECCVICTAVTSVKTIRPKKNIVISTCKMCDETGEIKVTWYNQPYISKAIFRGKEYVLFGKFQKKGNVTEILNPVIEKRENLGKFTGKIIPVYSLSSVVSQSTFMKTVETALEISEKLLVDSLPESVRNKYSIDDYFESVKQIHFPDDAAKLMRARERFLFEQFFLFFIAVEKIRNNSESCGIAFSSFNTAVFEENLPFALTNAQIKVINDIKSDIKSGKAVKRLIQGDVGSGKTVVAVEILLLSVLNGYQGVMMAPTEILATQHYQSVKKMLPDLRIELLTSSVSKKNKKEILDKLSSGEVDILLGTHAVIEDDVVFNKLGVVVCDEQHRFGVKQRQKLIEKGENPHLIVMTATPIPRTLSLILYGDLDVSIIDELPPGRKEISTYLVNESYRKRVYTFLKKHLDEGEQAYIVCPLVEESETLDLKDAKSFSEFVQSQIPEYKVGLLHGKQKDSEKNAIMDEFKHGDIRVLVSTTVIEVGVDVPNATIMIIENAERFGLSQIHQLRGRVGRGEKQSFCIMFGNTKNTDTLERLKVIEKSTDGFYISEQDLKMRGPGDFIGTRQSGIPALSSVDGENELKTVYKAKDAAKDYVNNNLEVSENECKYLEFLLKTKYFDEKTQNILN